MTNILSENGTNLFAKMPLCRFTEFLALQTQMGYTIKDIVDFSSLQKELAILKLTKSCKPLLYIGYREFASLFAKPIYKYIYRVSQYLPLYIYRNAENIKNQNRQIYLSIANINSSNDDNPSEKYNQIIPVLDFCSSHGWAIRDYTRAITFLAVSFRQRLTEIKNIMNGFGTIYFERSMKAFRHDGSTRSGFMVQLTAWATYHEILYQGIPVQTIKSISRAKKRASKLRQLKQFRQKVHSR